MATGMVTFRNDRDADAYTVLYESGSKPEYARKHLVEVVIADPATAGVPIAATLNVPTGVPTDIVDSEDEFEFSMADDTVYRLPAGGSAVVD